MSNKREYINILKQEYKKCISKKDKNVLINKLIAFGGYNRKYAIQLLNEPVKEYKKQTRHKQKKYKIELRYPLKTVWEILDRPCSKRLKPQLPEMINQLKKFKEIDITEEQYRLLCNISTWSIEELLKPYKRKLKKGKTGTKPSKYRLNKIIKVRTNFNDIDNVGHLEIDTVHHCGEKLEGNYAVTLNHIDIKTLWSEQECFLNCNKSNVISSLDLVKKRLPFKTQSVDFDNGTEFKNYDFVNYCNRNNIEVTRSRSYKKNDQCYIEGNNYTDVRNILGYKRYDKKIEIEMINDIYRNEHRLLNNFFNPNMKIQKKIREGSKITKTYDIAKTPYLRLLESKALTEEDTNKLKQQYEQLNPAELKRNLDKKLKKLYDLRRSDNYTKQQ